MEVFNPMKTSVAICNALGITDLSRIMGVTISLRGTKTHVEITRLVNATETGNLVKELKKYHLIEVEPTAVLGENDGESPTSDKF